MKLKFVKAHMKNYDNENLIALLEQAQQYINNMNLTLNDKTVYMVYMGGSYDEYSRKFTAWFSFLNNTGRTIEAFEGDINLKYLGNSDVEIAQVKVTMNNDFLGDVLFEEGVLVNYNIPVIGPMKAGDVNYSDLEGGFDNVGVIYK